MAKPITKLLLDRAAFTTRTMNSVAGDVIEYHRGNLAADYAAEGRNKARVRLNAKDRNKLNAIAAMARQLEYNGIIHLVQRRIEPGSCSYLAVRR